MSYQRYIPASLDTPSCGGGVLEILKIENQFYHISNKSTIVISYLYSTLLQLFYTR